MSPDQKKEQELSYLKELAAHQAVLKDIQNILSSASGKNFFRYLFESFEVGTLPEIGLDELFLRDRLGFLRAGNSVFKIVSEASPEIAANILAQIEKDKHEQAYYDETRGS